MNRETWKPVVGFEGAYDVSDMGRIRSLDRVILDRNGIEKPIKGRILSPSKDSRGYRYVRMNSTPSIRDARKNYRVHRVVMEAFVGPSSLEVDHINFDKEDNRLTNLQYVTPRENSCRAGKGLKDRYLYLDKEKGFWASVMQIKGKRTYLGGSTDKEVARKKRDKFLSENKQYDVRESVFAN